MTEKEFVFLTTVYERKILEKILPVFENAGIDFRIRDKSVHRSFRSPQINFSEADIHVWEGDFERATGFLAVMENQ